MAKGASSSSLDKLHDVEREIKTTIESIDKEYEEVGKVIKNSKSRVPDLYRVRVSLLELRLAALKGLNSLVMDMYKVEGKDDEQDIEDIVSLFAKSKK